MNLNTLSKKFSNLGLPLFWQYFIGLHFLIACVLLLVPDPRWTHFFNIFLKVLTPIGVTFGFVINKQKTYPWIFLVLAVYSISIGVILQSLNYFGLDIAPEIPFWIEQLGIVFIIVFGINILLLFENRNNLKGFTLDYTLLLISGLLLIFFISPDYLNIILYELSIYQQLSLVHLVVAAGVIFLIIINFLLISSIRFKDIILLFLVLSISLHFIIDSSIAFNIISDTPFNQRLVWFLYQFAGGFAIITIFIDKLELEYITQYSGKIATFFLWGASVTALFVVPVGAIYRWSQGLEPLNIFIMATASLFISLFIIFRFTVLIKNSNRHRNELMNVALTDELTGMNNYLGFCENYSIHAKKNPTVIVIDIEEFHSINSFYGREFGNKVLISLACRLSKQDNVKFVAREGADRFIVYLQVPKSSVEKESIRLHKNLGVWDIVDNQKIAVPLIFGVSHNTHKVDIDILIKQAEHAHILAKKQRVSYFFYDNNSTKASLHRQELRKILQQAIDENYLPVHFQPIYNIDDGSLKAIELLIRVESKEHGLLLPGQFLEHAESFGLLTALTRVCVCMIAKNINQLPNVTININFPPFMLENRRILNDFMLYFHELKLPPSRFCIEVIEDEGIAAEKLLWSINKLKKLGFMIAMDDFGTGYSSLSRLSILPFDIVKIDRSILLAASTGSKTILESTITLIKRLGLNVVVEGVETVEQLGLIRLLGADSVQGFLLSKPVDISKTALIPLNATNIIDEF